jgi:hypothetical protein
VPHLPRGGVQLYEMWVGATMAGATREPHEALPFTGPVTRNLIYHLWPVRKRREVWLWNVSQLLQRLSLFNGERVVAVAGDDRTEPVSVVRRILEPHGVEVIEVGNQPSLWEMTSWQSLWQRVYTTDPNTATFYAHAKGVRRPVHQETIRPWTQVMYESLLDYWPLIEKGLEEYPIMGSFRKKGPYFPGSAFHYSGTFYWVRQCRVGKKEVEKAGQFRHGSEAWPGVVWTAKEAGVVFFQRSGFMDLYSPDYWRVHVAPEWERWQRENAQCRCIPGASS